jgi:hypothetical protein
MSEQPTEPGYEVIDQFHARFVQRTGLKLPKFGHGHKALSHHGSVPRVVFVDTGGSVYMDKRSQDSGEPLDGSGDGLGDIQGEIAGDSTEWEVHIWSPTRQSLIELYHELIRTMREVVGSNLEFEGRYDIVETGEISNGRKLIKSGLVILTPLRKQTAYDFTLIPVETFATTAGQVEAVPTDPTYQTVVAEIGTPVIITQDEPIEE